MTETINGFTVVASIPVPYLGRVILGVRRRTEGAFKGITTYVTAIAAHGPVTTWDNGHYFDVRSPQNEGTVLAQAVADLNTRAGRL